MNSESRADIRLSFLAEDLIGLSHHLEQIQLQEDATVEDVVSLKFEQV